MNTRRPGGPLDINMPDGPGWANGFDDGVIRAHPHPRHHGSPRPRPSAIVDAVAADGDEEIVASAAGVIRGEIAEELAARIAAEEARTGAVLTSAGRRRIADTLITAALERWAHRRLGAGERLLDAAGEARVRRSVRRRPVRVGRVAAVVG